ncbi:MAG: serine/threonine-protein kinase [Candidatus Melainabacteria bacterium]|nr:serine/threonine-protein kinase [Candidatus Melainabacteria bacterium]
MSLVVTSISSDKIIDQRYQIVTTIGQGGMGKVYLVVDLEKNKQLALKTLERDLADQAAWGRFEREARNASRLNHPNIARVYDFGKLDNAVPYIVMELVSGQTLHERIRLKGPLSEEEALTIFLAMAAALQHAHQMNILHRDIKPANIIVVTNQVGKIVDAKLIDFGLAKCFSDDEFAQSLTATGELIGSPFYMSPEHWNSEALGPGSDIYSLGITLFESLTGKVPFSGENAYATAVSHNTAEIPHLANFATTLIDDSDWQTILSKMLAKSINERYTSTAQFAHDLHCIANGESVNQELGHFAPEEPIGSSLLNQMWLLVACSALFLLLTGVFSSIFFVPHKPVKRPQSNLGQFDRLPNSSDREVLIAPEFSVERNHKQHIFHFPADTRLGSIAIGKGDTDIPAIGNIKVAANERVLFRPDEKFLARPELFKIFGPDDLTSLCIQSSPSLTKDGELNNIKHLTRLENLILRDCNLTEKSIDTLNCLTHLNCLGLVHTGITGDGLAKLKRLRELNSLIANHVTNASAFLQKLKGKSRLRELTLKSTGLVNEDLSAISQIRNLKELYIARNPAITKRGLAYLSKCKKLKKLHLRHIQPEPGLAATLGQIKGLTNLTIAPRNMSQADLAALQRALPECAIEVADSEGE